MMEMLKKLFESSNSRTRHAGFGATTFLFVCACAALAPHGAEAEPYSLMGNDRILLMNDDNKIGGKITGQSYSNMTETADTFWVHTGSNPPNLQRMMLEGDDHIMYTKNRERVLWHLVKCRAGSGSSVASKRNYIPWDKTAKSILDGKTDIKATTEGVKSVGSVILQNTDKACIYSPLYEEGIGAIYFDAVNCSSDTLDIQLDLQIATNSLNGAVLQELSELSESLDWKNIDFTTFTVVGAVSGNSNGTLNMIDDASQVLSLSSTAAGPGLYYRVRKQLNYRGPIRFRIRRINNTEKSIDTAASLALVDNIIASYPPMSVSLNRYGDDYDTSLKGSEVLGCLGDFNVPMLSIASEGIQPRLWADFIRNDGSDKISKLTEATFHYRWRYLNQVVADWQTLTFDVSEFTSTSLTTSNLVANANMVLGNGVGDLEYFYTCKLDAPYYLPKDYATSNVGYGDDFTEAITAITNRANYASTPACGHDYFVRIRESVSEYEWVNLCASVTTNLQTKATNNLLFAVQEPVRMELINTNTWRYCYYVPTNMIGETLKFHFEGKKLFTDPEDEFKYASTNSAWYCDLDTVPYLPYTSVAGEEYTREVKVKLDEASTHLFIEFNDTLGSYSVSHGTFQNFNMWTDAQQGYRGNAMWNGNTATNTVPEAGSEISPAGVSDGKTKFVADMSGWTLKGYSDPFWTENFNTSDTNLFPRYKSFPMSVTPQNGWTVGKGKWILGARGSAANAAAQEEVALQMEGQGQGYFAFDRDGGMPSGIGSVSFSGRIAQIPDFDDFAVYADGSALKDYGISAKITMSRVTSADANPPDISPAQPSVSLVGRYRPSKGCYEYRITRIATDQLNCALYKWVQGNGGKMVEHLLTSNIITSVNNSAYAFPDLRADSKQTAFYNFGNMLVPVNGESATKDWTAAYFFMKTGANNEVYIECALSSKRNNSTVSSDTSNIKTVLKFTDKENPVLKGSYGIGSADCNAGFGNITYHELTSGGTGIVFPGTGARTDINDDNWVFFNDRWQASDQAEFNAGAIDAVMPSNQTVRLQFKLSDKNGGDNVWFDSGYETVITGLCTNRYTFSPCVSPDYKVRLVTGDGADDVVIDDVEMMSWRAADSEDLDSTGSNAKAKEWVFTSATLETSVEFDGPATPAVASAGTNGYTFTFSSPGVYKVTPKMDLIVDRMLLVGGGGAGGWTLGGGGGGGGVIEPDFTADFGTNMVKLARGVQFTITVGGGGDNYYVSKNDSGNWKSGGNGGSSSIDFIDAISDKPKKTYTAKGGGGAAGWNQRNAASGNATGGGAAQGNDNAYYSSRASGTDGQGNSGGRAFGDRAGGGGGASLEDDGMGEDGNDQKDGAGDGGAGRGNDITGMIVYYGGGGGGGGGNGNKAPDSSYGGKGGTGGGGSGLNKAAKSRDDTADGKSVDGTNGLGGGGGGGSHGGKDGTSAGGKGGSGTVILRMRTSSKVCTLQPSRGSTKLACGLRSPYLAEGLSLLTFNYAGAHSNCVLLVQVCTNDVIESEYSMSTSLTRTPPEDGQWNTIRTFDFADMLTNSAAGSFSLESGTLSHFVSMRSPYRGFMRLVVATNVMAYCEQHEGPDRDVDYGKITITGIHCYNEPPLDMRSWWGWNLHTEGWNTDDKQYAYLFDSPDGLSGSLNFSARAVDNETTDPDVRNIGLMQPELEQEYQANNSFVQCPPLTNGIGTVTFRARTFTTNQAVSSWVTLWGTSEPDTYQPEVQNAWTVLATYEITNTTYQTYRWSTTDDRTQYHAVRISVDGSRHGRSWKSPGSWENPPVNPIQRVWIDEITASEPIAPRIVFRDVRPFRSHLDETENPKPISTIADLSEQPILGESWGIQAIVEPQQMGDELIPETVKVYAAFYRGISPWGFANWKNHEKTIKVQLEQVASNLTFRSTYNNAASVIGPDMTPSGYYPENVWQYYVWAEYKDKQGVSHEHGITETDWAPPTWYYGIKDLNKMYGGPDKFAGYTILDSISPNRSWLNEVNICDIGDYDDGKNQFIEIAVPQGADISDWRIDVVDVNTNRASIAIFGSAGAKVSKKNGGVNENDVLNHYTFVTLRSPATQKAGNCNEADGVWNTSPIAATGNEKDARQIAVQGGEFYFYQPYGIELVRPSGIIEHQVVLQPTNYLSEATSFGYANSGAYLLEKLREADGADSHWFFAGKDQTPKTLGVFKSHGEDANSWTNSLVPTPGAFNRFEDGTTQDIDPNWFLQPNGTNVWIYASVIGSHMHQRVGQHTNNSAVVVMRKGASTNIIYTTDSWYQIGSIETNGVLISEAQGRASRASGHTWVLHLDNVEEPVLNVVANDERSSEVADAGLEVNDPYYNAVMQWLTSFGDDDNGIRKAEFRDLGNNKVGELDIKDMYWLNINPTEEGWVFKAGMGGVAPSTSGTETHGGIGQTAAVLPVVTYDEEIGSMTNVRVLVTMKIFKDGDEEHAEPPKCLQGIEPGSNSADYTGYGSEKWNSATFKICGALQTDGVRNNYYPLRWFVFGPESFDPVTFQSVIEIDDPHSKNSPGFSHGWNDPEYRDTPIFYKWKLNEEPARYDSVEMLKADSTY